MRRVVPVILCGGSGTRLWPLSNLQTPKQMLSLIAPETMLELTLQRVADPTLFCQPLIIASDQQAADIAALPWAEGANIIAEPVPRNTAPAVALAALTCDPDDLLLVLPSDHVIEKQAEFCAGVRLGCRWAEQDWFVTFGMKPTRAETGYGYIRRGPELGAGVNQADAFIEKPDLETACRFVSEGGYDWNAGIFLFKAGAMRAALAAKAPDVELACRSAIDRRAREGPMIKPHGPSFARSPAISIDYAIMEKVERIAVVPVDLGWSDLGSWDALFGAAPKGPEGNVVSGPVTIKEVNDCLIRSDGPAIAALGVRDLVVVAAGGAVLVIPREQSQRVKELVEMLRLGL